MQCLLYLYSGNRLEDENQGGVIICWQILIKIFFLWRANSLKMFVPTNIPHTEYYTNIDYD